ncbi:MAG: ArsB/NhaD family transporter [Candidatus Latescibacteria bacterium]|nr:ArsB/NhaD family transporter [Candidatus Latescibacterota bacterium]
MIFPIAVSVFVFVLVYVIIALNLINKATISILGVSILLLFGILTLEEAFASINLQVIFLLTSLMILANVTKETGLFLYFAIKLAKIARGDPLRILLLLAVLTAVTSAFIDNVTTIIMYAPIAVLIAVELGITPVPFIVTMVIFSNIGGTATLIGDPPNILIGYSAGLSFGDFIMNEGILVIIVSLVCLFLTTRIFGHQIKTTPERMQRIMNFNETSVLTDKKKIIQTGFVWFWVIIGFLFQDMIHVNPTIIAMSGTALILTITRSSPERFFAEVEWITIFFFIGLFILVGALEKYMIINFLGNNLIAVTQGNTTLSAMVILWGGGILSGFIDNIPFVAVMIQLIHNLNESNLLAQESNIYWWALSTGACFGGNFTLIGASANIIASEMSRKSGYEINFREFTKYGIVYTISALGISTIYLYLRYLI